MKPSDERKMRISDQQVQYLRDLAVNLRYGTITLTFQDGYLVQIDRNEKIRIDSRNR